GPPGAVGTPGGHAVFVTPGSPLAGGVDAFSHMGATLLLVVGGLLLVLEAVRAPRVYQAQYVILLVGGLLPWGLGLPALWDLFFIPSAFILAGFLVGGLVVAWGIFRYRVFDLLPIAVDTVVESMVDGVIVLDSEDRIVALNPAAQQMTGLSITTAERRPLRPLLADWPDLLQHLDKPEAHAEIVVGQGQPRHYDIRLTLLQAEHPAATGKQVPPGRLLLLRDVTEREQIAE